MYGYSVLGHMLEIVQFAQEGYPGLEGGDSRALTRWGRDEGRSGVRWILITTYEYTYVLVLSAGRRGRDGWMQPARRRRRPQGRLLASIVAVSNLYLLILGH